MADPLTRGQIHAVIGCYFVASFAALGLPPYLTAILPALGDGGARWAGLLYVVPTVCTALSAPLWGRLADRYGRKRLLLRAQLGLAISFCLAGLATTVPTFAGALVLQGLLGGTFSASNAYLGAALAGPRLSWALTLMQGGARAALVAAPVVVGALAAWVSPHRQYLLLAALPLAAAAGLAVMPEPRAVPAERERVTPAGPTAPAWLLYTLEVAFVFATVISFPYLIALLTDRAHVTVAVAGVLFALPHLCYLALARPAFTLLLRRPLAGIAAGLALVAVALAGHLAAANAAPSLPAFVAVRVLLGLGLTLGLVGLSVLTADVAAGRRPGELFGSLELAGKAGAVLAGLVATVSYHTTGPAGPLAVGAVAAAAACAVALSRSPVPVPHRSH